MYDFRIKFGNFKSELKKQYEDFLKINIKRSPRLDTYSSFKSSFCAESYLFTTKNENKCTNARKDGLICGVSHCSQMLIVCTDLICIMFLLFAKLGRNSNTVQSELSPIVQWMEFGRSPVTVLLNKNLFQYCVLPYIFFNIID